MTAAAEEKTPQYVHCKECKHQRIAFYAPIAVNELPRAKALKKCPNCGANNTTMMGRAVLPKENYNSYSEWAKHGDVGISSATILFAITGFDCFYSNHRNPPSDPDDFRRCYLLLKAFPELRPQLHKVSERYPEWKSLVEHWDELEALLTSEIGDIAEWKEGCAAKTYYRMKELRGGE